MSSCTPSRADDERILHILDLRDEEGMTGPAIAERMGMTRSAIAGAVNRIDRAELPCLCERQENRDGALGRRWWA